MTVHQEHGSSPSAFSTDVQWRHAFRVKLTAQLILLITLIVSIVLVAGYFSIRDRMLSTAETRAQYDADQLAASISAAMTSVAITGRGVIDLIQRLELGREESIELIRGMLSQDASAIGGLLVLDADATQDQQMMAFYVGVEERGSVDSDMIATGYDFDTQDWYRQTRSVDAEWWSDPYFNETAGGRWVSTLNLPIFRNGQSVGMFSLDILISELYGMLDGTVNQVIVAAPQGLIAVHPDASLKYTQNLLQPQLLDQFPGLQPLRQAHLEGARVEQYYEDVAGQRHYAVAVSISPWNWTLQVEFSQDDELTEFRSLSYLLLMTTLLGTAFLLLVINRLAHRVAGPVSDLAESARALAEGQFDHRIPHQARNDEVGVLGRTIDHARVSIKESIGRIERMARERQKLESELDIAREIQEAMLPLGVTLRSNKRILQAYATLKPAKAVGGDFYLFIPREHGSLFFAVGDVSDKGVPAALFMARTITVISLAARLGHAPNEVLRQSARFLAEDNDSCMFATVLAGSINPDSGKLELATAGHDPPVLLRSSGEREFLQIDGQKPLGLDEESDFPLDVRTLSTGDTLLMYTDGITEAFNHHHQAYGDEALLSGLAASLDAEAQGKRLIDEVMNHVDGAPQSDDITVAVLQLSEKVA